MPHHFNRSMLFPVKYSYLKHLFVEKDLPRGELFCVPRQVEVETLPSGGAGFGQAIALE
jgi:hypothetical protein